MTRKREDGTTVLEVLVAAALTLVVAAVSVALASGAARTSLAHPWAADEQQRLRAGFDQVVQLVARAGEGLGGLGPNRDHLLVPAAYPQRRGVSRADADTSAFGDRLTIVRGASPPAFAALGAAMAAPASPVVLDPPSCAPVVACGFGAGDRVLIADARASGEWFTVTRAVGPTLEHEPAALGALYSPAAGTAAIAVEVTALAFDSARRQVRLASPGADVPLLDGVAGFDVAWFGDPRPPRGPRPPPDEGNCVVNGDGSPRLSPRAPTRGPWVELTPRELADGPWCGPTGWRYDADLFRVRLLRVRLRLETPPLSPSRTQVGPGAPGLDVWVAPVNLGRSP